MINILLSVCLSLFLFSYSLEEAQASEIQFHTLDLSAHLSSTSLCNRASTNGSKKRASSSSSAAVLEVVHKHGPCAAKNTQIVKISLAEMLAEDQLRVQSIHKSHPKNTNKGEDKEDRLRVQPGLSLGTGNYIVKIGFGKPARTFSLVFDTGSDVTWIQCLPCQIKCYDQKDPIFNPSASTSYSKIPCLSQECSDLDNYEGETGCYDHTCRYEANYGDGSFSSGFYSKDQLTVTPATDVIRDFRFGCGIHNKGLFGQTAGILGLGRSPLSFVYQTEKTFSKVFSYCLPDIRSTGFLSFGRGKYKQKKNEAAMMIITPLLPAPPPRRGYLPLPFYYVDITAIRLGGRKLPIDESVFTTAHTVVDSGTVITRLPPGAYKVMSAEFKRQMTKYKPAPPVSIFDTCFHIRNLTNISLPTMSFTFKGNATLDLDPSGILYAINSTQACLAFARNSNPKDVAVFGNVQQRKLQVMFDVPGKKVGFLNNANCHL